MYYVRPIKALAFSDLHVDLERARELAGRSVEADLVIGAGDFASVHSGLEETIEALSAIEVPTILVPGNNETEDALRAACQDWPAATVLHGGGAEVEGVAVYGLGAGVPITPWDWSFDLDEEDAARMLAGCPEGAVLVSHSPPHGHCDVSGAGEHLGSAAVLEAIEAKRPWLVLCGHIHESWGERSSVGKTEVINLGPAGELIELGGRG